MKLLEHLLVTDPGAPRLTIYDDAADVRLDFSAQTLDNWAAKIAGLLVEELDLTADSRILIDLPVGWHSVVIALGALATGVDYTLGAAEDVGSVGAVDAVFTTAAHLPEVPPEADCVLVTSDPLGRGVVEMGEELPPGAIDFGPTVRAYPDVYLSPTPVLADVVTPGYSERTATAGWTDRASLEARVLGQLAAGGSAVVAVPPLATQRLAEIARVERATRILD